MSEKTVWETTNPLVLNARSTANCTHFALSLQVAIVIVGTERPEFVRDKVEITRFHRAMSEEDQNAIVSRPEQFAKAGRVFQLHRA